MAELVNVKVNPGQVKERLRLDYEFFIHFYHGDALTYQVPQFHIDGFALMVAPKAERLAIAWPRGYAKTTLAKLAAIYEFLFSPFRFVLYLSNTDTLAVGACKDIMDWIMSPNSVAVFGEPQFHINRPGEGHYEFTWNKKYCILFARGTGQQVRGLNFNNCRPQVVIGDDVENFELLKTEARVQNIIAWFFGEFLKCLDPAGNKIIMIGNLIAVRSLLNKLISSEDWISICLGCLLADGSSLWPELHPVDKIREDFQRYLRAGQIHTWYAEMMNLVITNVRAIIQADQIQYAPPVGPPDVKYGFITIDLAISANTWANKTAIVAHGWTGAHWQIVEHIHRRINKPDEMFRYAIGLCMTWGFRLIGIESNAFQGVMKPVFELLLNWHNLTTSNIMIVNLYAGARKTERLVAWCLMITQGEYKVTDNDLEVTQQLLEYDPLVKTNVDDLIDSCAHGPQMIARYSREFMQELNPGELGRHIPEVQFSKV